MDAVEKNIKTDLNNILTKIKKSKSKSTYVYNLMDLSAMYELCELFYIDYSEYDLLDYKKINSFQKNDLNNNYQLFQENTNFLKNTSRNISEILNCYNFMPIYPKIKLSTKEIIEITKTFLNYYNKSMLLTFEDMEKNQKIIYYKNLNEYGLTYSSKNNNFVPYIILNNNNTTTIMDCVTLVHEITHAHYFYYRNLSKNSYEINLCNSSIHEIPSYTSEIFLYKWLQKNRICTKDIKCLYNDFFYFLLNFSIYFCNLYDNQEFYSKHDFEFFEKDYVYNLDTFIGKVFAIHFESFENIEQVNNIINNFYTNHKIINFENLIKNNNLDLNNIINFSNGKKLIKKLYSPGGYNE